ncbi:MAG TPA: flagella basal body P-ring formation protein FlgA [Edaphobacter sp.]
MALLLRMSLFLAAGLSLAGSAMAATPSPFCASTPELALRATQTVVTPETVASQEGYRVASVRRDPLLNQSWATVVSCSHPERPSITLPLPSDSPRNAQAANTPFPVVHAGDLVQLWGQQRNLRIEVAGKAEESGATGNRVRVRLLRTGLETGEPRALTGIVRGPGNVEIMP